MHQSKGNHVFDCDGNILLDLCGTETLPLGHNADVFTSNVWKKSHIDSAVINGGLDQGERAGADAGDLVQDVLMPLAPEGLSSVTLTDGSSAVEKAIFAAMRERGSDARFSVMGFNGANHGNSLALTQFAHPNMSL